MAVQENSMDMSQYKGPIRVCEYCKPEEVLLGRSCRWCMAQGYLSICLSCKGEGKVTAGSMWDGGRSQYTSTCNPCGGKGVFPAREADFIRQQARHGIPINGNGVNGGNGSGNGSDSYKSAKDIPRAVLPMPNLNITRSAK